MSEHNDPLRNLETLRNRVETHSNRVLSAHPDQFACQKGCAGCCATEREINDLEYAALQRGFAQLDTDETQRLMAAQDGTACPLLVDQACSLYEERPLICRSHGLPIVMESKLDVCPLNFEDIDLKSLPDTDLLSVDTITAILTVSNMLFCQETGGDPNRRRPVSSLWANKPSAG
jgi:hypothetical protein